MTISIIGAGNIAWHLTRAFEKAGVGVNEVYARDINKALSLANSLYAAIAVNSLDFSKSDSNVFFLCVSDDAIAEVSLNLVLPPDGILVHTSGAKPLSILPEREFEGRGVFYPLQTFTKGVNVDFADIPVLIEGDSESTLITLNKIAKRLSRNVKMANSNERLIYHVSAVFSCNFTNHLWAISKEILESENLDFELLKPLIVETVNKMVRASHPADVQTGPAVRNDTSTINNHLRFLSDDEDLLKVYTTLTESISDWHRIDS